MKSVFKILFIAIIAISVSSFTNIRKTDKSNISANPDSTKSESELPNYAENYDYFRMMFYNAENLFDTFDDTLKNDEAFLPEGQNYWTWTKYTKKIQNICKVITAVGGWNPPAIVGMCEIENRYVLEGVTQHTPLKKHNYQVIHFESGDKRGIDVGMLYLKSKFTPISARPIRITFPFAPTHKTRDVLYVKGVTFKQDTIHIFINHWPSKYGGEMETVPSRNYVGDVVKEICDSISKAEPRANIFITGDLNDGVEAECVKDHLDAHISYDNPRANKLYNLSYYLEKEKGMGSHKFQGEWSIIDHLIVSGAMLDKKGKVYTTLDDAHIFNADFLMEKDEGNYGFTPFRTYLGMKFHDGFSDHLPVFIDLHRNIEAK